MSHLQVKNALSTALTVEDVKGSVSEMQVDIRFLVDVAKGDAKEASKIFGVDRMTAEQRRRALRKTTLVR